MTTLKIAYLVAAVLVTLAAAPADAKSLWTQIDEVSPLSAKPAGFVERGMGEVFTDLGDVAPRSGSHFDMLSDNAP